MMNHQTQEAMRERLYEVVRDVRRDAGDPALDRQVVDLIASDAPEALSYVLSWLHVAERVGREEAERESDIPANIREWRAALVCSECGGEGRGAAERDIPSEGYDVRTAGEWLEAHDGLTICDRCDHRWWIR